MPLVERSIPQISQWIQGSTASKALFLIFYSSKVDGKMWCPDCVDVEPTVRDTFDGSDKPDATIYWVGKKEEWRTPANKAGVDWNVNSVPTVIRLEQGKETARLVESEILNSDKWQPFVKA